MILNRRTLLASIGLVLPVVGAQATVARKRKPHVTKVASHKVTRVSATKSHHTPKPHISAQS